LPSKYPFFFEGDTVTLGQNIDSDSKIIADLKAELTALRMKYSQLESSFYQRIEKYENELQACNNRIERKDQKIEHLKSHVEFLKEKATQLEEKLTQSTDSRIKEIEEHCEQEKQSLTDVICLLRDQKYKKGNIVEKRALTVLNKIISMSAGNRTVKLDSAKGLDIIINEVQEQYARLDKYAVNNPYKAIKDVFEKLVDIGKEKGLAISIENQRKNKVTGRSRIGSKKLLVLKYEPSRSLNSGISALNNLQEKLKVKLKLNIPKPKEIHPDFRYHIEKLPHFKYHAKNSG
jgi:chromosome segregation ATPase